MTPTLETARLLLRPVELADAEQIQAIFPQWEIVKYLANKVPWPYPPDGALSFLRDRALPAIESGEQWLWTIRRKEEPGALIGIISLMKSETENRGFWLAPQWQGRGLMSEACDAVTDYWFETLEIPSVARAEGDCQRSLAPHFGKARHACHCIRRARLRLRPPALRNVGDHR